MAAARTSGRDRASSRTPNLGWLRRAGCALVLLTCLSDTTGSTPLAATASAPRLATTTSAPAVPVSASSPLPVHQMVWTQWTVMQGLPQITVNDMVQDFHGYLWVAMQDGVARFDGINFEHYPLSRHPGLGHSVVSTLGLDGDGQLWAGTVVGASRLLDGRWQAISASNAPEGIGYVQAVVPHPRGGMWLAAENGLFHAQGTSARRVLAGRAERDIATVLTAADGSAVAVAREALIFDPEGQRRVTILPQAIPPVIAAARAADGGFVVGTVSGLVHTDALGNPLGRWAAGREVESVAVDAQGSVWFSTERGLRRLQPGAQQDEAQDLPGIRSTEWVRRVFIDREANLWVGTQLSGLHRGWPNRFRRITARDGLTDAAVWTVYEAPDHEIWAGTPDGLYRGGLSGFRKMFGEADLPHPAVFSSLRDRHGGLWIGTQRGLAHVPAGASRPALVPSLGDFSVKALLEDDDGSLLVGTGAGLFALRDGRAQRLELPVPERGRSIQALVRDGRGRLWVGHNSGAHVRIGNRWQAAPNPLPHPLNAMTLTAFGDEGVLMAGIDGLFYFDTRRARRITTADGLHNDAVTSIMVAGPHVWYQALRGIGRIESAQLQALVDGRARRFDARVYGGLGDAHLAECNGGQQQAGALTGGRWLWCPSLQGLLVFDTARADERAGPAPVVLQWLTTPQRKIALGPGAHARIALDADERDLEIGFTGLRLRAPQRLDFRARLRGYDDDWQTLGQRRASYYTNLPPGAYTYELYAMNEDGVPGPITSLGFRIRPYWHETLWARVAVVLLLVLLVWLGMRRRLRGLRRQREQLEQRVRERTAELEQVNQKLESASVTDPLTGLHNRRFLQQQLPHELARVDRLLMEGKADDGALDTERVLSVLHIDLDRFKQINDSHGHHVGDQVLQAAAELLRANARASDFVLRWGGEEFLIVGRDTRRCELGGWAARIVCQFREHEFVTDAGPLRVTCSIGYAVYPPHPGGRNQPGWNHTMMLADAATYVAKQEGRDRSIGLDWLHAEVPADLGQRLHNDLPALLAEGRARLLR